MAKKESISEDIKRELERVKQDHIIAAQELKSRGWQIYIPSNEVEEIAKLIEAQAENTIPGWIKALAPEFAKRHTIRRWDCLNGDGETPLDPSDPASYEKLDITDIVLFIRAINAKIRYWDVPK